MSADSNGRARVVSGKPAIVPSITGRAWITGTRQLMLDPDGPWPGGYKIADTWPVKIQVSRAEAGAGVRCGRPWRDLGS